MFLIPLPFMPYCTPRCSWWRCDCSCTEGNILRPAKTLGSELAFPSNLSEPGGRGELWRPSRVHQEEHVAGRVGLEPAAGSGFPSPASGTSRVQRPYLLRDLAPGPPWEGSDGIGQAVGDSWRSHTYVGLWDARWEQMGVQIDPASDLRSGLWWFTHERSSVKQHIPVQLPAHMETITVPTPASNHFASRRAVNPTTILWGSCFFGLRISMGKLRHRQRDLHEVTYLERREPAFKWKQAVSRSAPCLGYCNASCHSGQWRLRGWRCFPVLRPWSALFQLSCFNSTAGSWFWPHFTVVHKENKRSQMICT